MKQQSGSKRLSTFARYVVSYMLVLLLALSALFLYMYVYMNREVRAQVISNGINRLSRIAYQHEGYLDNMLNTAEQIGLSPYLQPFSYRDEPWRAYELMQQLVPYTVSNDFSDQMYLCFASDDYLYSSSSMMTLDMFSSLMHYEHVSGAELMRLIRQPGGLCVLPAQKVASSLLGSDQYDMTTFIIPLGMSQKSERGSMLFLLRQNTYQQLFSDAIAMNANTCILHDGAILASSGELPLSAEELTSLLAGNEATMQREFVSGGVPYTLLALGNRSWGDAVCDAHAIVGTDGQRLAQHGRRADDDCGAGSRGQRAVLPAGSAQHPPHPRDFELASAGREPRRRMVIHPDGHTGAVPPQQRLDAPPRILPAHAAA